MLKKLDEKLLVFGLSKKLKIMHQKNRDLLIKKMKKEVNISTYYNWINGKTPIPIKYLKIFSNFDSNLLKESYHQLTFISAGRKKCKIPKKIDKDVSYILGVLHGDGYVHKNMKYVTITVESEDYIKNILKPIFYKLFNTEGNIINFGNYYRLEIGSKVIHSFISLFCPVGKKVGKLKIPPRLKRNKSLLTNYLSGLFDTDGCISFTKDKKQVYFVFVQKDKNFVYDVYRSLKFLDIDVNEPRPFYSPKKPYDKIRNLEEWRIYIGSKKVLSDFLKKIKFKHPIKYKKSKLVEKIIMGRAGFEPATSAILKNTKRMKIHVKATS